MFKRVTLELSLKPFKSPDTDSVYAVCRQLFNAWRPLIKGRETVAVMLWCADGSELLDYAGDDAAAFDWCCWFGTANLPDLGPDDDPAISPHKRRRPYIQNPPRRTYADLKRIIASLKEAAKEVCPQARILVGETFDIGPEFAVSEFKYRRHPELCPGFRLDNCGFVDCTAFLHADERPYAGFPDGIPEGTPFGTFLGRQAQLFCRDMGFDYLWLSNGLGFSANPWDSTGKIYDGEHFHPEKLAAAREAVAEFWRLLRAETDLPIETRGTNQSVGIDYASDGVPLYEIYRMEPGIVPPPNSPWAALNYDVGLELMGHMTRIARLPGRDFLFRYYIHDPWWMNSPWYDRYEGSAYDIYLPMAITRIDEDGRTVSAGMLSILSADNTRGEMPECCVNEPLPHLLKAEKDASDALAPLTWVYPMREYATADGEEMLRAMYEGDRYIRDQLNDGLPLNCVADADLFLAHDLSLYAGTVLLTPAPISGALRLKLREAQTAGIPVIVYGKEKDGEFPFCSLSESLREKLYPLGWKIAFEKKRVCRSPVMTLSRHDNALLLSAYQPDTTTDILLRFPMGAPAALGRETEIRNGTAVYRFARGEHMECRVFVEQENGIVSARESAPVSDVWRRRILLTGLDDACVRFFPEAYCGENDCMATEASTGGDRTPVPLGGWRFVRNKKWGAYYTAEHVSGDIALYMRARKEKK